MAADQWPAIRLHFLVRFSSPLLLRSRAEARALLTHGYLPRSLAYEPAGLCESVRFQPSAALHRGGPGQEVQTCEERGTPTRQFIVNDIPFEFAAEGRKRSRSRVLSRFAGPRALHVRNAGAFADRHDPIAPAPRVDLRLPYQLCTQAVPESVEATGRNPQPFADRVQNVATHVTTADGRPFTLANKRPNGLNR